MKRAFLRLPPATQKLIAGAGITVLIATGLGMSWQMHARAEEARRAVDASTANHAAMAELVSRFNARQTRGSAAPDLSALVTRSLQGKDFQPSQLQQQNGELALRFDGVPFAAVLAWMVELEDAGVVFSNVGIAQAGSDGVSVTLVMRGT
ncbi:MAG TPA: type II secretion system protein GspM [Pseudomonadales bacterium]